MWWTHFKEGKPSQVFNFMPFLKLWTNSNPKNLRKKSRHQRLLWLRKQSNVCETGCFLSANCCPLLYASMWFMYLTVCYGFLKQTLLKDWPKIIIPIFKNRYSLGQSKGSGSLQSNPSHPSRQLRLQSPFSGPPRWVLVEGPVLEFWERLHRDSFICLALLQCMFWFFSFSSLL